MVITLRGDTLSLFILSGDSSWITSIFGTCIGLFCTMWNISVCYFTIVLYGAASNGFFIAWMRSCAASATSSAYDMHSIGNLRGKIHNVTDLCCCCFITFKSVVTVMFHY